MTTVFMGSFLASDRRHQLLARDLVGPFMEPETISERYDDIGCSKSVRCIR